MAELRAEWSVMEDCSCRLRECAAGLERSGDRIAAARGVIARRLDGLGGVPGRLRAAERRLDALHTSMHRMNVTLSRAAEQYKATEQLLLGETPDGAVAAHVLELLKGAGFVGSVCDIIRHGTNSSDPAWLRAANVIGDGLDLGAKIVKVAEKPHANWAREIFGFTDKAEKNSSFTDFFEDEFSDYRLTDGATLGDKLTSVAKWGGLALTLADKGYGNYQEYKSGEISADRAVAETLTETGVDILTDALLSAGVAALMVAAVGSAPAIVVSAGVVLATWGLDWVSESLTGKKLTEAVSDLVLDTAEKAVDKARSAVSYAVDTAEKAVDKARSAVSSAVGTAAATVGKGISAAWCSIFG